MAINRLTLPHPLTPSPNSNIEETADNLFGEGDDF
jgi:hypothetical protein